MINKNSCYNRIIVTVENASGYNHLIVTVTLLLIVNGQSQNRHLAPHKPYKIPDATCDKNSTTTFMSRKHHRGIFDIAEWQPHRSKINLRSFRQQEQKHRQRTQARTQARKLEQYLLSMRELP